MNQEGYPPNEKSLAKDWAIPRYRVRVPIVSMIEGIWSLVTSIPLNKPQRVPENIAINIDKGIPKPAL